VQGTVAAQVRLAADGTVTDASIVSGPDELRKAVLESVLSWHFTKDSAGGTRTVTVSFQLPAPGAAPAPAAAARLSPEFRAEVASRGADAAGERLAQAAIAAPWLKPSQVVSIEVRGLSEQVRADLLAALPIHVGDAVSPEALFKTVAAARAFDNHLRMSWTISPKGETTVIIVVDGAVSTSPTAVEGTQPPLRVQVGGNVQAALLIYGPKAEYPRLAKQARISGVVRLHVFISKEGNVQSLTVIPPAHPLLAPAAVEAVRQWTYKPTLLNGQPVEVETTVDVSFALADQQMEL
jgi:TonB family protein